MSEDISYKYTTSWKIRLYPNKSQEEMFRKTIGCCRKIYNEMLSERIDFYEQNKDNKDILKTHKYKTEKELKQEYEYLKEVDSIALQQSRRDLESAYKNFFKSKFGYPKFHKKGQKDSYRTQNVSNNIKVNPDNRKICIPKIGWVSYRDKRTDINGKILNLTISMTKTGKFFASIIFEKTVVQPKELDIETAIQEGLRIKGLDMSLEHFYIDEEGNYPENFRRLYREYEKKIKYLSRQVSKKQKGSNNRKKAQLKLNKVYEKIANLRKDFIEKLSTELIKNNDVIVVETLSLQGMSQALNLGKSVMDLGYSMFVKRLEDKAKLQGKLVIKADKWYASSKTCSKCGYVYKELKLSEREWTCPECGEHHYRDHNAGQNLITYGFNILLSMINTSGLVQSEELVEMSELSESMKQEAVESLAQR